MKQILIGIAVWSCINGTAQTTTTQPETVYSIAMEVKEISWYETQLNLWKKEIDKDKKNGEAWSNYYAAARALRNLSDHSSPECAKYRELCTTIVTDVQKAMPNSFESNYLSYSETGIAGPEETLMNAAKISPYDWRILDELMIRYEVNRNKTKFKEYAVKMYETNTMPVGMLNWGYNALAELDENAILFTCGDNDTYSAWIIQQAKNFRKDVVVVNTYMMHLEDYRNKLLTEMGYPPLKLTPATTREEDEANTKKIMDHFFKGKRPVYVPTTAIGMFEENYGDKLYLTGLTYKYSETSFDNASLIRRNYEKRYLLDYLKETFSYNFADLKGQEFNGMYLPSMVKLCQLYTESEETAKKAEMEALMMNIAKQTGREEEVRELMAKPK